MDRESVLEVRHLNSYYPREMAILGRRGPGRQVLRDVTFTLYQGEILGLVGESGCGKTTLSRAIVGMLPDYEGEIIHHSQRPQMVFQDPFSSLNPARTIGWTLDEPLRAAGVRDQSERRRRVAELLEQVGLGPPAPTAGPGSSPAGSGSGSPSPPPSSPGPGWWWPTSR